MNRHHTRWLAGVGASVLLLLGAAGTAQMQGQPGTQALDGQRLVDQAMETQEVFRGTWGDQASEQWVTEHNAELARAGMTGQPMPEQRPPSETTATGQREVSPTATAAAVESATVTATATGTPIVTVTATVVETREAMAPTAQATTAPVSAATSAPTPEPTRAPGRTGGGPYP